MLNLVPLVVFGAVIALVLARPAIKLPRTRKRLVLDFGIAPLLGVAFLLITSQASFGSVTSGIIGTTSLKPYSIILLFFSLAYICISIDITGFFAFLSLWTVKKSGSSGRKLFLYFFALSSFLTVFTSNDIVILTLTPIILYFCKYTNINPVPFLIGQFFAANIWSTALYVGNPTNIIVAQAYALSFVEYSAWMLFPTAVAGISCLSLLFAKFGRDIPATVQAPDVDPASVLKDKDGAIFGINMLASCLFMLAIAPMYGLDMGMICLVFALIMVVKDLVHDTREKKLHGGMPDGNSSSGTSQRRYQSIFDVTKRMPWKIMPFVLGMFILVEMLDEAGWTSVLAGMLSSSLMQAGTTGATIIMAFLSSFSCNIMNNQPMTILFTSILQDANFMASASMSRASMFALVMGSNFGANFTLIGALAGIMWASINSSHDVTISYKQFARHGFTIMPVVVVLSSVTLAVEFLLFP